jgi:hypothetical protein
MRHHDRGADLFEERHERVPRHGLRLFRRAHEGDLRHVELVEDRIAREPRARPLRVQLCLRPQIEFFRRGEALLRRDEIGSGLRALRIGVVAGARTPRLIDDIDRVALAQEIFRPAHAAVGVPVKLVPVWMAPCTMTIG